MSRKSSARRLKRNLDLLPRWIWYLASLLVGGPIGPIVVYTVFYVLTRMEQETEDNEETESTGETDYTYTRQDDRSTVYGDGYTVMNEQEAEAQKARAQKNGRRVIFDAPHTSSAKEEPFVFNVDTNADVPEVIRQGNLALREIRRANDLIPDPALSAQIDSIEKSCRQILRMLEERPELLSDLRTFLRYYLPTTLRLLDARAKLDKNAYTPKAREVRSRISEALGKIDIAFKREVNALDEYQFVNLESEMDVLTDMLKADGLLDDDDLKTATSTR